MLMKNSMRENYSPAAAGIYSKVNLFYTQDKGENTLWRIGVKNALVWVLNLLVEKMDYLSYLNLNYAPYPQN